MTAALSSFEFGSPASLSIIALFVLFSIYAARDAHDHARTVRYKELYRASAMHLSEASSGSYLFHISMMVTMLVVSFFFLIPPVPKPQITTIEFVQTESPDEKVKVKTYKTSTVTATAKMDPRLQRSATATSARPSTTNNNRQASPSKASNTTASATPRTREARRESAQAGRQAQSQQPSRPTPPVEQTTRTARVNPRPILAMAAPTALNLPKPQMPAPVPGAQANQAPAPRLSQANALTTPLAPALLPLSRSTPAPGPSAPAVKDVKLGGGPSSAPSPRASSEVSDSFAAPQPVSMRGTENRRLAFSPSPRDGKTGSNGTPENIGSAPEPGHARSDGRKKSSGPISIEPALPRGVPSTTDFGTPTHGSIGKPIQECMKDIDFAPFMADLQRRIKRAWFPPKGPTQKAVVRFNISLDGSMRDMKLQTSSGVSAYDQAAMNAVKNAAPFKPLPEGAPDNVNVEFTFDYRLYSGGNGSNPMRRF
ncbi:MAG: TonB family protein [Cyanobacteria bacterium]|nr:TonB family protein [Cyanobacteriota bacterium]